MEASTHQQIQALAQLTVDHTSMWFKKRPLPSKIGLARIWWNNHNQVWPWTFRSLSSVSAPTKRTWRKSLDAVRATAGFAL